MLSTEVIHVVESRARVARQLVMGGVLLCIDSDRDDMPIAERISAAQEVMSEDGEEGNQSGPAARKPVLN